MTNRIKKLRIKRGLTQRQLAEDTRLSLRTIQRIEASDTMPKGHTLKCLEDYFQVTLLQNEQIVEKLSLSRIKLINFSVLLFIFLPVFHVFLPLIIWKYQRNISVIREWGRYVVNFQLVWIFALIISMVTASFIQGALNTEVPIVLYLMFAYMLFNLSIVGITAISLSRKGRLPSVLTKNIQLI